MVTKTDVLRLIEQLNDDELRIVYTFIEEYQAAKNEEEKISITSIHNLLNNKMHLN